MPKASILLDLIEHLELNVSQFEKEIKAANGSIGKLIANDSGISRNLINKIILRYPKVNKAWLESGTGVMIEKPTAHEQLIRRKLLAIGQKMADLQA